MKWIYSFFFCSVLCSFQALAHNMKKKKRVFTFNSEHMPWSDLKKEHVQSWRQLYLWVDKKTSQTIKDISSYEEISNTEYMDFADSIDQKLLPGVTSFTQKGLKTLSPYEIPMNHRPGLITENQFFQTIPFTYTFCFFKDYLETCGSLPKTFIATAALGGFRDIERHLIILRPVLYKTDENGRLTHKKSLTLGQFYGKLIQYYDQKISEEEKANLVAPQNVTLWKVKHIHREESDGNHYRTPVSQPHLIMIRNLAPGTGLEVTTPTQQLAIEASDQLVQQDLRMFFYSLANMAYWIHRKKDKRGLHHDPEERLELNFIEEVFRLLETRHQVEVDGKKRGYISTHLLKYKTPPVLFEIKQYAKYKDPKDQVVRNKCVEEGIRDVCKKLHLPCASFD